MMNQYGAQRFRPSLPMIQKKVRGKVIYVPQTNDRGYKYRIGTVPVGTIVYLQDNMNHPSFRAPWQVIAWKNREYYPGMKGAPRVTYMIGGHLAVVKCLGTGRVQEVSDHLVLAAVDAGYDFHKSRKSWKRIQAIKANRGAAESLRLVA